MKINDTIKKTSANPRPGKLYIFFILMIFSF
jgi:hypothetical protein